MTKRGPKIDKPWTDALRLAANRYHDGDKGAIKRLAAIAEKLLLMALDGDMDAIKELGNRLDGKPHQSVDSRSEVNMQVSSTQEAADEFTRLLADRVARAGQASDPGRLN